MYTPSLGNRALRLLMPLWLCLGVCATAIAQVTPSLYSFTATSGSFNYISGTNEPTVQADDDYSPLIPIGFTFNYCGVDYTELSACSNGFITLGAEPWYAAGGNDEYTIMDVSPVLFPLWDDLDGDAGGSGTATYTTTGSAPNRVFTFEWKNWEWNFEADNPVISFQVKLYEGTNVIEYIYKREANAITQSMWDAGASIGIGLYDGNNVHYKTLSNASANPTASSSNFYYDVYSRPANGQIYRFTPPPPCTGVPTACNVVGSAAVCEDIDFDLTLDQSYLFSAIEYQWQSSTDNGATWNDESNSTATNAHYVGNINTPQSFRCRVICTAGPDTIYTPAHAITLSVIQPATMPYSQSFENWISKCRPSDVPDLAWTNTPASGNNSWRRDDEGFTTGDWTDNYGDYSPTSSMGDYSARFHSAGSWFGDDGVLDLHIDLSGPNFKIIRFDFINPNSGDDQLAVELSTDGGSTFSTLDTYQQEDNWVTKTIYTSASGVDGIIRFRASSLWGSDDMGMDNLSVFSTNCLPPSNFRTAGITTSTATFKWSCDGCLNGMFKLEYGPKGFAPGSGTLVTGISDTSYTLLSGVNPGSYYEAYVYKDCAAIDPNDSISPPTGPIVFALLPENDSCGRAITLIASATNACGGATDGTTVGATETPGMAGCLGDADDDVWFKFTAVSANQQINISSVGPKKGTSKNMNHEVFAGDCNTLVSVKCVDADTSMLSGLAVGSDYYVRVWTNGTNAADTFKICVTGYTQPANDSCHNAQVLTIQSGTTCVGGVPGNTYGGTASAAYTACGGVADDDVWYKFTATSKAVKIKLNDVKAVVGQSKDMFHQLYDGDCNALSSIRCSDEDSSTTGGLILGEEYYIRVWTANEEAGDSFKICLTAMPTPANDVCGSAQAITCGPTYFGNTEAGMIDEFNISCDPSGVPASPGVWYAFTGTGDSVVVTTCHDTTNFNTVLHVFTGPCSALVCMAGNNNDTDCPIDDANATVSFVSQLGQVYYILLNGDGAEAGTYGLTATCYPCAKPLLNAGRDTLICASGSSLALTATGDANSFVWNTGATTQTINITTPGSYTVIAASVSGCANYDTVAVGTAPLPTIKTGNDTTICVGGVATLTAVASTGSSLLWSTGATTPSISVNIADQYIAVATNEYMCQARDTVVVLSESNPVVNLGPDVSTCPGVPVTLNAGYPGYSYKWNTGATTQATDVHTAGTFWVDVENSKGCKASDTIEVTHLPLPVASFNPDVNGTTVHFDNTSLHGANMWWYFGDQQTSTSTSPTHTYTMYGTYMVKLIVENDCGKDTASVVLGIYPTGVNEYSAAEKAISLYPNPSNGSVVIKNTGMAGIREVELVNAVGAVVYHQAADSKLRELPLNLQQLAGGIYMVRISTTDGVVVKRLELIK
jgi:PKD repeat protein